MMNVGRANKWRRLLLTRYTRSERQQNLVVIGMLGTQISDLDDLTDGTVKVGEK